jgi:hypothetical protein
VAVELEDTDTVALMAVAVADAACAATVADCASASRTSVVPSPKSRTTVATA